MKKLLLPLSVLITCSCAAQGYLAEKVTYFDENGTPVKKKEASRLQQTIQLNDTLWETNLYPVNRPRTVSFQSTSADGQTLNGRYITYDGNGRMDTLGEYSWGKRTGHWYVYTPSLFGGRLIAEQYYSNGDLLWTRDTAQLELFRDSLRRQARSDSSHSFTKVEIDSKFSGGRSGWQEYLNHTLRYPSDAADNMVMGRTIIMFVVDKNGDISPATVRLDQSVCYSIDKESIRVICKTSGRWTPAVQDGKEVQSYKKQPLDFNLEVKKTGR